ncbi:leukocyte immunoglobulin-like receptor subfamily A member 5 [Octodon degus]|uniref:Leukocyte immunoglobulin-like receptor subfamily A member 5 n=1 Tax=Octodon degus TaxID=10160 RepID=A0A6P6DUM4_OCTDE|nr:leukocyte immunoglobulin-like receptor subfamily A member 5 [Octodon degus]
MMPKAPALLCLGLSLQLGLQGPAGTLPKPTLWAEPSSVILLGSSVSIWCQGILGSQKYRLYREGRWKTSALSVILNKAKFFIQSVRGDDAGRYRCYYSSSTRLSQHSEPLELVVAGVYSKPSLLALPGPVLTSGGNVTLQCGSQRKFDRFILTKEGRDTPAWTQNSQRLPNRLFQAVFHMGPVFPEHSWTFRCYGSDRSNPHVWSIPSDPVELLVSGSPGSSAQSLQDSSTGATEDSTHTLGPQLPSRRVPGSVPSVLHPGSLEALRPSWLSFLTQPSWCPETGTSSADISPGQGQGRNLNVLIWVLVAFFLLLALLVLLRLQHKSPHRKAGPSSAATSPEHFSSHQAADSEGPDGVIYAQLSIRAGEMSQHKMLAHGDLRRDRSFPQVHSSEDHGQPGHTA